MKNFFLQKIYLKIFGVYCILLLSLQNFIAPLVQFGLGASNTSVVMANVCPISDDIDAVAVPNGTDVTISGTCDNTEFSSLNINLGGQTQSVTCTSTSTSWSVSFQGLQGSQVATVTGIPVDSSCQNVVKNIDFVCGNCVDPVTLTVNAPNQTSATSVTINGSVGGNWSKLFMNGQDITNSVINGNFSVTVQLTPGYNTTFTFVAQGIAPCGDKTVVATITCNPSSTTMYGCNSNGACVPDTNGTYTTNDCNNECGGPVCTIGENDLTVNTPVVNGTTATVGGYCDSSKYSQVKVELMNGTSNVSTQTVNCVNNAWTATFSGLSYSTSYSIRVTTMGNINSCGGSDVDTVSFSCGGPVCTIGENDLTVNTPVVNGTTATVGGYCDSSKYSQVKVELMNGTSNVSTQTVNCVNNAWTATFSGLSYSTSYSIRVTTMGNINSCGGSDVDTVSFSCGGPVCTIGENDLTVNTPVVNGTTATVGGYCDSSKYSQVKVELMNGTSNVSTQTVNCVNNAWTATFSGLSYSTSYSIRVTTMGNINSCGGSDVDTVSFSCGGPVCTIGENDLTVNTPVVNGTTATVGGYCDSSKYSQVKVELMNGTSNVSTQTVNCVNNAWTATFSGLSYSTSYSIRVTTMGNINSCGGSDVDTVSFSCGGPVCTIGENDLTVNTPVVNGTTATVGGYCDSSKYSQVKVELMNGTSNVSTQTVNCVNNAWTATFSGLSYSTSYSIRVTTMGNINSCGGSDVDMVSFSCGGPVCTIGENDLTVNTPVVNGTTATVGGYCDSSKYSQVKVELMNGTSNVSTQTVNCVNNAWTATFSGLSYSTSYSIRVTTMGNINSCGGSDVDTVSFSCGGPVCTIGENDLTVNTPVVNGTTATVGGYCDSSKYSQVKVELMNGTSNVSTQTVNCVNNAWTATFSGLSYSTSYSIRVTTMGNINSCGGSDVDTVSFSCGGPVCTIGENDLTVNTPVVNGTTATVGGYCDSSKYSQVKVELMNGTSNVSTQTVNCVNNAWTATFSGLSYSTSYSIRVTTMGNINSCGGSDVDTVSFSCGGPVCTHPIQTGDYTANVSTSATTATIFGSYNTATVQNVYIIYSGVTYRPTLTNGSYSLTLNNVVVNTLQSAVVYFTAKDVYCKEISLHVSFTCNHGGGGCSYPITDVMLNYNSGAVVTSSGITLQGTVVGYGKEYTINGMSGSIVNGVFSRNLSLVSGNNTFVIQVYSQDTLNCSVFTKTITIVYQPNTSVNFCTGFTLTNLTPLNNLITTDSEIRIQGTVSIVSGTKITISPTNSELLISTGGVFSGLFSLNLGTQTFTITAKNASGCEASQVISITRNSVTGGGGFGGGGGSNYCGDGVKRSTEQCDDGNYRNGDGCDSNCYIEQNTVSTGSVQTPIVKRTITTRSVISAPLNLSTVQDPIILPKTGGIQDIFLFLLQIMQSLFA